MLSIDPATTSVRDLHQYLISSVSPRPIAFVSSLAADGTPNLAPYSFFNAFGANPPTLVFSSNRRVRGNTTKDTLGNVRATGEAVVNIVNYRILHQMNLASGEFPPEINEFEKSGLTPLASDIVRPARVAESPVQMECKVQDIITLGEDGGAGHLVICEIVRMHIQEDILDEEGRIDPWKIDAVARMGQSYYCRPQDRQIFPVRGLRNGPILGMDQLPLSIRHSDVLTGNDLAQLAAVSELPQPDPTFQDKRVQGLMNSGAGTGPISGHRYAQELLRNGDIDRAWQVLLALEKS